MIECSNREAKPEFVALHKCTGVCGMETSWSIGSEADVLAPF